MKRINILLGFIGMAALLTGGFSSDVYAQNNANAVYFAQQQKTADSIIILKQTSKFELIPVKNVWVTGINPAGLVDVPVGNNKGASFCLRSSSSSRASDSFFSAAFFMSVT